MRETDGHKEREKEGGRMQCFMKKEDKSLLGSSRIVIIFTSVHSVLFFVTPSPSPKERTFKMLIRGNPYQNGRACVKKRQLQRGVRNKSLPLHVTHFYKV